MKFLTYVLRNARRNPVRSLLTIASTGLSLFLVMILFSFFTVIEDRGQATRVYNRIVTINSQGFAGMVPIKDNQEIAALDGVVATTPFSFFGGKYADQTMPFAQFGVSPDTFFTIYSEFTIAPEQLKAWQENMDGCVIGKKLADDWKLKVGDPMPLKGDIYPVDLKLTVRGIYDGPEKSDRRMCLFRWDYFDEAMKQSSLSKAAGNAGCVVARCKSGELMAPLSTKIDDMYRNSDNPTRTQTEEAFTKFFVEMLGDLQGMVKWISIAVGVSLLFVSANALAMALRERTTEVAVLKAIGFSKLLVLMLVLAEAMIVAGIGGLIGTFGCKLFCDVVDVAGWTGGFLPFFYVPWPTAIIGFLVSLAIGFASGLVPAWNSARLSVVNGLRKVV